jgi:hypothetical protein
MNDLTKELNKLIQTCQDMTDVLKRATILIRAIALHEYISQKCEDGIFNNIDSADDYQLKE